MPSRHSAKISINFDADHPALTLYTSGFGNPDTVRRFARLAIKSKRRRVLMEPELFAVNMFLQCGKVTQVYLTPHEIFYAFIYHFDLHAHIPTVSIESDITGERDELGFFKWVGPDYRTNNVNPPAPPPRTTLPGHRRRGRPTNLSKILDARGIKADKPPYAVLDGVSYFSKQAYEKALNKVRNGD